MREARALEVPGTTSAIPTAGRSCSGGRHPSPPLLGRPTVRTAGGEVCLLAPQAQALGGLLCRHESGERQSGWGDMQLSMGQVSDAHSLPSREVMERDAKDYADSIHAIFVETSAKNAININELFIEISEYLRAGCAPAQGGRQHLPRRAEPPACGGLASHAVPRGGSRA